ncbi:hypothetical protein RHMOL_Rhmol13G0229900 [Rhododendron molle]|uniref:Uncharacterized protein n=1 Tax=Rhododendron molle TaxID=49168 RepID=A0ACC0LA42_RHOML|nr:hypothetical protein RHMOL_Rhmol13G0229900 [Rhododendron molle]
MLAFWNKSTRTPRLEAQLDCPLFGYGYADVEKDVINRTFAWAAHQSNKGKSVVV